MHTARRMILLTALTALLLSAVGSAALANKPGASWKDGNEPVCTLEITGVQESGGNEGKGGTATVSCTEGKVAGLGNQPYLFNATLPGGCVNSGDNEPPGHLQTGLQPITPRGGHIITPAFDLSVTCPNGQYLVVGDWVTYTLTNLAGELVFSAQVPLS
jgi:hypothetical protein